MSDISTGKKKGGSRKHGRSMRKPSHARYQLIRGWERNTRRRLAKDLFRRVLLLCRVNFKHIKKWKTDKAREMIRAEIKQEVYAQFKSEDTYLFFNADIERWATVLCK